MANEAITTWCFTVHGDPVTKGRPRIGGKGKHAFTPQRTVDYEKQVAGAAVAANLAVGDRRCDVVIAVWPSDNRRRDPDNIAKIILDGMQKAGRSALADDSFANVRSILVYLADIDAARARVDVLVVLVERDDQPFPVAPANAKPWGHA